MKCILGSPSGGASFLLLFMFISSFVFNSLMLVGNGVMWPPNVSWHRWAITLASPPPAAEELIPHPGLHDEDPALGICHLSGWWARWRLSWAEPGLWQSSFLHYWFTSLTPWPGGLWVWPSKQKRAIKVQSKLLVTPNLQPARPGILSSLLKTLLAPASCRSRQSLVPALILLKLFGNILLPLSRFEGI
jgi:hypothetical protein